MNNDTLALLVVIGLGGFVLWYLTKAPAPLVNKDPPCAVSAFGVTATCAAIDHRIDYILGKGETVLRWGTSWLPESLTVGSTEVCRSGVGGFGGKAVYPNDQEECRVRFGIVDCIECGKLYNLKTRQWPWTAELNVQQGFPAGAVAGVADAKDPLLSESQPSKRVLVGVGKPQGFR